MSDTGDKIITAIFLIATVACWVVGISLIVGLFEGGGIGPPGDSVYAITVGYSDINGKLASSSSWGPTNDNRAKPDVVAPGVDIIAPRAKGTRVASVVNEYYIKASGNSMAVPQAAGAVALLIQAGQLQGNNRTPAGIKAALMNSAETIGEHDFAQGRGLMNTSSAYSFLQNSQITAVTPHRLNLAIDSNEPQTEFKLLLINDRPLINVSAVAITPLNSSWLSVSPNFVTEIEGNRQTIFSVFIDARDSSNHTLPLPLEGMITISDSEGGVFHTIPVKVVEDKLW